MLYLRQIIKGFILIAILALFISQFAYYSGLANIGISSLVVAIVFGIILGNVWSYPTSFKPGIQFCAKTLLRTAIILYGFRVSFEQIAALSWYAIFIDLFIVVSTLFVGYQIGKHLLKLDSHSALLISAGSAICGAAAVLAVEDVLKSEPYKTAVAIGTVVLFGTLSMFIYPLLQNLQLLNFSELQYAIFTGASIHEVAQVVVAGTDVSANAGEIAVVIKMIRVILLMPVLFLLSYLFAPATTLKKNLNVPWFAIGFILVIGVNSLHIINQQMVNYINYIDIILLTMAMGAIGVETHFNKIKNVGLKPLYLAIVLLFWLIGSAFVMVKYMI